MFLEVKTVTQTFYLHNDKNFVIFNFKKKERNVLENIF